MGEFTFEELVKRLGADIIAGSIAGAAVSPVISAVDRALAENASGKASLFDSFLGSLRSYAKHPLVYLRGPQFAYIWLIYGGTYCAANVVDTVCFVKNVDPAMPKWAATSTMNTSTCMLKDRAFAKLFGASGAANASVPAAAYGAWLGRDLVSMGVFFTLPPIVGDRLTQMAGEEHREKCNNASQFALPLMVQFITTPLHLLGYDIYNNPKGTVADRIKFLQKDYLKNVSIRIIRALPPWSVGTIGNREVRQSLLKQFGLPPLVKTTPVLHLSG